MKVERPLVEALVKFSKKKPQSFHVPGHKNGLISHLPYEIKNALQYDFTELTGLDDLHHPEEVILSAQKLLAKTYGAEHSYFLVNGSTVGNLAMVYATCKRGDKVLVQRNAHKSIFNALELVEVNPVYLAPEWDERTATASYVSFKTVKKALHGEENVKAIILTSPSYYGVVNQELLQIVELAHAFNVPVLIDEAHGAHFAASEKFPQSALQIGADIVVQSAHKTLPAMTMASFLHINSNLVTKEKVEHYLRMLQSSSPSYLLMASLDDARAYVECYLESDAKYCIDKRNQWIEAIKAIPDVEVITVDDPLKLIIRVKGYTGTQIRESLEAEGLYVELADPMQVLAIVPLLKYGEVFDYAQARTNFKNAMVRLKSLQRAEIKLENMVDSQKVSKPSLALNQIQNSKKEWIPYMRAIGKISSSMIIPYPPGIPLLLPGEKITVAKLSQLEELILTGATFQGNHRLEEKLIEVISEEKY